MPAQKPMGALNAINSHGTDPVLEIQLYTHKH